MSDQNYCISSSQILRSLKILWKKKKKRKSSGRLKAQWLGLPSGSNEAGLGWGLRLCISSRFPEDAGASTQRLTLRMTYVIKSFSGATCQCRRHRRCGFNPWVGKIPWRRTWQSTPLFLPRESHGQRTHGMEPWTESMVYRVAKSWTRLKQLSTHATTSESCWFFSVQFSCSVVSDSLQPHGLQHSRLPCPSPTPGAYSNSCPWSWWCHWFF